MVAIVVKKNSYFREICHRTEKPRVSFLLQSFQGNTIMSMPAGNSRHSKFFSALFPRACID